MVSQLDILTMKTVCISVVIFETLVLYSMGQVTPPTRPQNWDERFGPRPNFFGGDSGRGNDNDRRNFFGNNFPRDIFPRRNPPGGNDGRRPVEIPPPAGGEAPRQLPPSEGPNPDQAGGVPPGQDQTPPQMPPFMGGNPGQVGPSGGMGPAAGQGEAPPFQPPSVTRPGREDPLTVDLGEEPAPRQPPVNRRTIGEPTPMIPELPVGRDRGMGQPPNPGETELMNPGQPPMTRPPVNEGPTANGGPNQPEVTPGMQIPSSQPPGGLDNPQQLPQPQSPDQGMTQPGQFGGQEPSSDPFRQGGELGRQRRPMGQVRGPGRQGNMYTRPPRYQTSK